MGEDFDTSVDVFSFGVVLAEMMARHVVDPQHFQRLAPDFRVSTDEILFRAQPGCPVELGELAIHCVHPLPQHRPKLREIVERLTAIENVDIHVGTTLVVAPSVARAARNMMMKQQAETKKQQEKQPLYLHGNVGLYPGGLPPENTYPTTSSSIRGVAESSMMTSRTRMPESSDMTSRMASSSVVGSQSTFRGRPWKQAGSRELEFEVGSSVMPFVLGDRLRERGQSEMDDTNTVSMRSSEGSEDENAFRMPRWDSINSPDNLEQLRQWHQSNPASGSIKDEEEVLQSWNQERHQQVGSRPNMSQLSSIQLELNEHDDDGEYSCNLDSDESSDEELDSLFDESSDYGTESRIYGQMGSAGPYELSSDSDASLSSSSLTESVVRALDTLEIPDLQMASLPDLARDSAPASPGLDLDLVGIREAMDAALGSSVYPQDDDDDAKGFKKPQVISRLLPPIPTSENPWTSFQSPQANTGRATERKHEDVVVDHQPQKDMSGIAPVVHAINVLRTETLTMGTGAEAKEIPEAGQESDTPPEPPSKSSILLRTYSLKANQSPPITTSVAPPADKEPTLAANDPMNNPLDETPCTTTLTAVDSAPTSTASSETSASVSSASSTGEQTVKAKVDGRINAVENNTNGTTPPRAALVRGMSDSLLESTSTSNTAESGYTITGNIIAAMGARTWTGGTGGFGHWISQYRHGDAADKTGLKKHTSLKEGKQQRQLVNELSNLHGFASEESEAIQERLVSEPLPSLKEDESVDPMPTVKRRAPKPLTGFPHRFSLVVFSAQLLPKCDVCLKRLGVLPGWSAKHLECDGKIFERSQVSPHFLPFGWLHGS